MLTIKQITDNTDAIIRGLEKKHFKNAKETIEQVLETNNKRRNTQTILDKNLSEVNSLSKSIGMLMKEGKKDEAETAKNRVAELKEANKALQEEMDQAATDLQNLLYTIPNVPYDSVPLAPVGAGDPQAVQVVVIFADYRDPGRLQGGVLDEDGGLCLVQLAKDVPLLQPLCEPLPLCLHPRVDHLAANDAAQVLVGEVFLRQVDKTPFHLRPSPFSHRPTLLRAGRSLLTRIAHLPALLNPTLPLFRQGAQTGRCPARDFMV